MKCESHGANHRQVRHEAACIVNKNLLTRMVIAKLHQAPRAPRVVTRLLMWNHKCKRNNKWNLKQGLQEELRSIPRIPCTTQVLRNGCHHQGTQLHQAMMVTLHQEDTRDAMSLTNHMRADVENHKNKSTICMLLLFENYL